MSNVLTVVTTEQAPKAVGPYSQAVIAGGFVFCSGQIGINPATGDVVADDISTQTKQVFENLKAVLEAAGSSMDLVVKTDVMLADMKDYPLVNEIYGQYFTSQPLPARQTVQVAALPKAVKIEISCIAALPSISIAH